MSPKNRAILVMLLVAFLSVLSPIDAQRLKPNELAKVRGRVVRKGDSGKYPVAYVRVTLAPRAMKERRKEVYTGSDGMFYLSVPAGAYILEVWNSENKSVASYLIVVDKPNVDLEIAMP